MSDLKGTPAYECLAYQAQAPTWAYLADIFCGIDAWLVRDAAGQLHPNQKAETYLPMEGAEESEDYLNRLTRSPWDDRFTQSLRKFTNLILANGLDLNNIPPALAPHLENLDNQGTPLRLMLEQLMVLALRDGHCFVLIDYPPADGTVRSEADFQASGRRPYWVAYEASQVIHWRTQAIGGRVELLQVTLREMVTMSDRFNEATVERYRVLFPGGWQLYQAVEDEKGETTYPLIDQGVTSQNRIPLVCLYGGLKSGFFQSRPPLKSLADLNVTHYQVKSDHLRKLHLCCLPVPVLRDSMRPENEDLKIGPNSFLHIRDPQGIFTWAEPLATSIEQSRREVGDLEASMDILSGSYLAKPSDRQAAFTTQVQSAEIESSLTAFAESFAEGVNQCLQVHGAYTGTAGASIKLSGEIVKEKGTDSQLLAGLNNMATTLLALYQEGTTGAAIAKILLQLMQLNYFLPDDFDYSQLPEPISIGAE
jgi:hypothetical protein